MGSRMIEIEPSTGEGRPMRPFRRSDARLSAFFGAGFRLPEGGGSAYSHGFRQVADADQVVSRAGEEEPASVSLPTLEAQLAATSDGLGPAEALLDPLADALTDRVAGVPCGSAVDRSAAIGGVLGDVWSDLPLAASLAEVAVVVGLVRAHRSTTSGAATALPAEHEQGSLGLGVAGRLGELEVDEQAVAVLHQRVAGIAELGLLAAAFAGQPSLGIGGRAVGEIAPLLPMEVDLGIAVAASVPASTVAIPGLEALGGGPGLQQGAVDGEVVVGDVALQPRVVHHGGEELVGDVVPQQPAPVFGERAVVEAGVLGVEVEEPFEQQVEAELLAELPLAPNREQGHQHGGLEQVLRRHADPAVGGVHRVEGRAQRAEHVLDDWLDAPDGVVLRNEIVRRRGREHGHLPDRLASHGSLLSTWIRAAETRTQLFALPSPRASRFSTPC